MTQLTDQEFDRIVKAVIEALNRQNPPFVTVDVCNECYGWLRKAVLGLYGLVGATWLTLFVAVIVKG